MKFIVIEGLDGSGKTTQIEFLKEYFATKDIKTKYIHFPDYNSPVFGELITKFLRGELGSINEVHPYLVALLYAGDRNNAKDKINGWLRDGYVVLADRYVYSNIAYQSVKIKDNGERKEFMKWILDVEYNYFKIPKPDLNIYLDVPFEFVKENLKERALNEQRKYLKGKKDIHEADFSFQEQVYAMYKEALNLFPDFKPVTCYDEKGKMLSVKDISAKIIEMAGEVV